MARGVLNPGGTLTLSGSRVANINDNFTIMALVWMSSTSSTANWHLSQGFDSPSTGYGIGFNIGGAGLVEAHHHNIAVLGGGAFTPSTWFHIAYRRQSGTGQLFKDGASFGASFGDTPDLPSDFSGAHFFTPGGYEARVAEWAFYDAALPDAELVMIGAGRCPMGVRVANLLAHYHYLGNDAPEQDAIGTNHHTVAAGVNAVAHPITAFPQQWGGLTRRRGR